MRVSNLSCRIQQLESFADQVSGIHNLMDEVDPTSHLHNPVNSLHLVGRFTNNWGNLADLVYQDNSHGRLEFSQYIKFQWNSSYL